VKRRLRLRLLSFLIVTLAACSQEPDYYFVQNGEAMPGGDTTFVKLNPSVNLSRHAYSQAASNLAPEQRALFTLGNAFFTSPWVAFPSVISGRDGLGPLFNAAACQDCHLRDGRGYPPGQNTESVSSLLRIALPNGEPDPVYGGQIQDRALAGLAPEAELDVLWHKRLVTLADGEQIELRNPVVSLKGLNYGEIAADAALSLRVAPAMIGLGLLENISAQDILAGEDGNDLDGDGISGRANRVWSEAEQASALGRFGWKAGQPTVRQQSLLAFSEDIGVRSGLFPKANCTARQLDCLALAPNEGPELASEIEAAVVFYAQHLAVPARRWHETKEVLQGKVLFNDLACTACHRPSWQTESDASSQALANQLIWPYSDMLLHDMGEDLADGVSEFDAEGQEWRTAPLWGIHLAKAVGGQNIGFLHDGRARNFKEAIMWHGGEAEKAKKAWAALPKTERENLIWFLKSL
jgi:CxxC motif-containing protein (DUF1111 family)